jgi:hypothetical protein
MDEDDRADLHKRVTDAMRVALGSEDAFRAARIFADQMMIEGDIGIIRLTDGLIRKADDVRVQPEIVDRAARELSEAVFTSSPVWVRRLVREFVEGQEAARPGPSV